MHPRYKHCMCDWEFALSRQNKKRIDCSKKHPFSSFATDILLSFNMGDCDNSFNWPVVSNDTQGACIGFCLSMLGFATANKTPSHINVVNIVKINWHCVQTFAKYWQVKACFQTTVKCWQVQGPEQQTGGWSNYHTHTDNFLHTTTRMLASSELREHVEIYSFQRGCWQTSATPLLRGNKLIFHSKYTKVIVLLLKTKQRESFWDAGTQRIEVPMLLRHASFFAHLKNWIRNLPRCFPDDFFSTEPELSTCDWITLDIEQ